MANVVRKERVSVDNGEFVAAYKAVYDAGGSLNDLAERLNLAFGSTSAKATALRKAGVKLPKFADNRKRAVDVDALNALLG